jgi:hypothetical protein
MKNMTGNERTGWSAQNLAFELPGELVLMENPAPRASTDIDSIISTSGANPKSKRT